MSAEHHHHDCDCAGHRHAARGAEDGAAGVWATLLPMLACAVCPACMATYAKLLSLAGIGIGFSEAQHTLMLALAIAVSMAVSGWRAYRTRRAWPLVVAAVGAGLVLAGHLAHALHALEWAGVLVLLGGGVAEQVRLRRPRAQVAAASAP